MFRAVWANWICPLNFRAKRKSERKASLSSMLGKATNWTSVHCGELELPRSVLQGAAWWGAPGLLFIFEIRSSIQCDCLLWACLPLLPSKLDSDIGWRSFQLSSCFGKLCPPPPLALRINFKCWCNSFLHWEPAGCYSVCAMENEPLKHVVDGLRGLVSAGAGQGDKRLASALAANLLVQA